MIDIVYADHLRAQGRDLTELCSGSSQLDCKLIQTDDSLPPNLFIVEMRCRHLVKVDGVVNESAEPCLIAIQLPADYLRRSYPYPGQILSLVAPRHCWHPNVRWPAICAGMITAGTSVVDLVLRTYEIFTYNKFMPREDDCLNGEACQWARTHMARFPLESRPLRDVPVDAPGERHELPDFVLEVAGSGSGS